jgi:hypothetical protein
MAYLLLFGTGGWTQRWEIPLGEDERVQSAISQVGQTGTGQLAVIDSQTNTRATLFVSWQAVAAAVIVDSHSQTDQGTSTGQYA